MPTLPFTHTGTVIHGEQLGRTIGFPTANLSTCPNESEVMVGVYAGSCEIAMQSTSYNCLIYFGPRYIFQEIKNNFEVFLYDFSADIYGQTITVTASHFLRPPLKLSNVEELEKQLLIDKQTGLKLLQ